jgi:cellulose biosynthesis protein BcsQ
MKTIAAHVEKGGTGKTTTIGNIAYWIAKEVPTVVFDADPQGNLTSWYVTDEMDYEFADVLYDEASLAQTVIMVRENLGVVPTFGIDGRLGDFRDSQVLLRRQYAFADAVEEARAAGFEVALFDMGPGISNLEKAILAVTREVIAVAAPEYFSFDGLEIFENELSRVRNEFRTEIVADRVVLNRVNRSYSLHEAYREQFDELRYELYIVGQSTSISDAVPRHRALAEYDPRNQYSREYRRLARDGLSGTRLLA